MKLAVCIPKQDVQLDSAGRYIGFLSLKQLQPWSMDLIKALQNLSGMPFD